MWSGTIRLQQTRHKPKFMYCTVQAQSGVASITLTLLVPED